jgi:hypothetical protein
MSDSTPSRRAGLSADKLELLRRRLGGDASSARAHEAIARCAGPGPAFPMSFAQERMWFVAQYDPGNPMYNISGAELVRADLDVASLERALAMTVFRHEGLRTVFRVEDGELRQVVLDTVPVRVELRDERARTAPAGCRCTTRCWRWCARRPRAPSTWRRGRSSAWRCCGCPTSGARR